MRRRRILIGCLVVLLGGAVLVWHQQSALIGIGLRWYLGRIEAAEAGGGSITERRTMVANIHRLLLMDPPPDELVPELFEVLKVLGERTARGDVSPSWSAYLYTDYLRRALAERPDAQPPRNPGEVTAALDEEIRFYSIRHRPDAERVRLRDLFIGDGHTVEEIEQAAREGRELPLR
jgi:hypothetical protein